MGLLDAFKRKPDALLEALKAAYGLAPDDGAWQWRGAAHGRALRVRPSPGREGRLDLALFPAGGEEQVALIAFFRPPAPELAAMPRLEDADWRERIQDAGGAHIGAGFALDWDVDDRSPFVTTHSSSLLGHLERFSDATEAVIAELPWIVVRLDRARADAAKAKHDLECADAFLRFFEERRFADGKDLWRHSSRDGAGG